MDAPLDGRERDELCNLFLELGPAAPTLCEGWSTTDLAAHLVVRERDLRSAPGILLGDRFPALERYTTELMDRAEEKGYEYLVARVRSGPPPGPFRLRRLRTVVNLNEFYVHHEDVRRANGGRPRPDRPDLQDALWSVLGKSARLQLHRLKGVGVDYIRSDSGERINARKGEPLARLVGLPGELALLLSGRREAAQVEVQGDAEAVATFEAAKLGI